MSTLDRCMIRDFPLPQGSMRYRDASTIPLTPPARTGPSSCSTEVSTITHAPLLSSVRQDLKNNKTLLYYQVLNIPQIEFLTAPNL